MCGILGILAASGRQPSVSGDAAARLRDRLAHRGPDACGVFESSQIVLAHRRLKVVDLSEAGAQPMRGERFVIVYNGELYNDAEVRAELGSLGARFHSASDTETILRAWELWGRGCLPRLRGMYALAVWDRLEHRLTLARDPLGIKPLYYAMAGADELVFASEIPALLGHPRIKPRPNPWMVSAYLTTIRTVLGEHTLFEGVHAVKPAEWIDVDASRPESLAVSRGIHWTGPRVRADTTLSDGAGIVRNAVQQSVRAHLRSDVPVCCLLSGGLDSTIIATEAAGPLRGGGPVRTFAAGAADTGDNNDLDFARFVASRLGTRHAEAVVTRELFAERWAWMVSRLGVPLSTPNEVAIHAVSERLRADGCVVTLSGEGADELLGGYELPLTGASQYLAERAAGRDPRPAGAFELAFNGWMTGEVKASLLTETAWRSAEADARLQVWAKEEFARAAEETGSEDLSAHLRFQRRVNLTGLLQRLDTATMLAGVEGRTPFADATVAEACEALPMACKFLASPAGAGAVPGPAAAAQTKLALRAAFADRVAPEVLSRPKASFPLPFQEWVADSAAGLCGSGFARAWLRDGAAELLAARASEHWNLLWPMINLARWWARWW
ncbi:MAG: asparagine synthase (glutamine-hydrolyzing) [Phycisphaerales bacterium]|nr:asparagine synthase (glutamine-hydrolyzing) [Phycisphaerales bacterium]